MISSSLKDKLDHLPHNPGCYLMKNGQNEIIYVGKAKNLWNRVHSYFTGTHNPKTEKMISHIVDFDYIITPSNAEAFILEMNLIKKNHPHYNISLMDDKQYPYICISQDNYPRLFITRSTLEKAKYFGPYPNVTAAKETVDFLNTVYPLRKCVHIPPKECLYYHLHQCVGPCIQKVDKKKYATMMTSITKFLKGTSHDEGRILEDMMNRAAEALDFEHAISYRDMLNNFKAVQQRQNINKGAVQEADVINYVEEDGYLSIFIFHVRAHKVSAKSNFLIECIDSSEEEFLSFLGEYYIVENHPIPQKIIVPNLDYSELGDELNSHIHIPQKGHMKELLDLVRTNAYENMTIAIRKQKNQVKKTRGAQDQLKELLGLDHLYSMESFDNSNNQGQDAVSAMIVVKDGEFSKKDYRKYRVKTVEGASDYDTMIEVITRRYKRLRDEGEKYPDLIIQDGGKIQVDAALRALQALGITTIPVLGLIKNDMHKTEALYWDNTVIKIDKRSDLFYFLENIQDEVHRYAISFYHQLSRSNSFSSQLDSIKGIGEVKKKQILRALESGDKFIEELDKIKLTEEQKEQVKAIYNI